jgi:hypothetical protein
MLVNVPKNESDWPLKTREGLVRNQYYIEWWDLGTQESEIQNGTFRSAFIVEFIKAFRSSGKRNLIYLKRLKDNKVIYNARVR